MDIHVLPIEMLPINLYLACIYITRYKLHIKGGRDFSRVSLLWGKHDAKNFTWE